MLTGATAPATSCTAHDMNRSIAAVSSGYYDIPNFCSHEHWVHHSHRTYRSWLYIRNSGLSALMNNGQHCDNPSCRR